jgi:hypothetical protein
MLKCMAGFVRILQVYSSVRDADGELVPAGHRDAATKCITLTAAADNTAARNGAEVSKACIQNDLLCNS